MCSIIITDEILGVITALCEKIKEEWQILLIGKDDGAIVYINDYYVPEQEYGSAHVTQQECVNKKMIDELGIVAGIHSHSTFEPYFSSVDEVTNNSLIKTHIVVNNAGKFVATKRVDLACGMKKFIDAKVMRDLPEIVIPKTIKGIKRMKPTFISPITYPKGRYNGYTTPPLGFRVEPLGGPRKKHAFEIMS